MISPSVCACGIPWEEPCRCPEKVLESFSLHCGQRVFYFEQFHHWMQNSFGENPECDTLINQVLNLDGVIELGTDMYEIPYEI